MLSIWNLLRKHSEKASMKGGNFLISTKYRLLFGQYGVRTLEGFKAFYKGFKTFYKSVEIRLRHCRKIAVYVPLRVLGNQYRNLINEIQ